MKSAPLPPPLPRNEAHPTLDYSGPAPAGMPWRRRRVIDGAMAFTCVSAAVVVTIVLLFVVPMVERVFEDFKTHLPTSTVALLGFARFCRGGGIVLVWGLLMVPPFVGPLFDPPREEGRRAFRPTRLVLTLFLAVFFGWIIFALFTPYTRMIDSAANMK